jgi:hypothetical protein
MKSMNLKRLLVVAGFGLGVAAACGGKSTNTNGGSSGSGGSSGAGGGAGSGGSGAAGTGGGGMGGGGSSTGSAATGSSGTGASGGGSAGTAVDGGSHPDAGECDAAAGCVLCADHNWHCVGESYPPCPPGTMAGGTCPGTGTQCFSCSGGTGTEFTCGPGPRWIMAFTTSCSP